MHADDPGDAAADLAAGGLFGDTGLGRPVIGSAESISALSRDQIRRHWRRHYVPGTMVVAATGAVDMALFALEVGLDLMRQQQR